MLRVRSAEGDVISFIRARADGLRGWLAIYATIMLAASGISVAGISLTARAMEGPSGEAFGSPLLLEPTALAIHTVGKPSGGGAWFLPTNGSIGGYLRFPQAGDYDISILAQGTAVDGVWPQMQLVVDDQVVGPVRETGGQCNASNWVVPLSAACTRSPSCTSTTRSPGLKTAISTFALSLCGR